MVNKPPLGVMPKEYYDRHCTVIRFKELKRAISEYTEAKLTVNPEWIKEHNHLLDNNKWLKDRMDS
jgi:hypothetical protein